MAAQNSLNNRSSVFTVSTLTAGVVQSSSVGLLSSSNGSNGQILIGGGAAPAWANITSSGGTVTVTNGANTIDLSVSTPVLAWTDVTGTSQSAVVNSGYTTNNAGLVTVTLPSTAAYGSIVYVVGKGAGGWKVGQNAGQTVHFLGTNTTTGTGGSLASTVQYDSVELLCTIANTDWTVIDSMGNITIV
jgi:hypothetical protein